MELFLIFWLFTGIGFGISFTGAKKSMVDKNEISPLFSKMGWVNLENEWVAETFVTCIFVLIWPIIISYYLSFLLFNMVALKEEQNGR